MNLLSKFKPTSSKEWKQKIQFELKGQDYNETLVSETLEGIKIKPFYYFDGACLQPFSKGITYLNTFAACINKPVALC